MSEHPQAMAADVVTIIRVNRQSGSSATCTLSTARSRGCPVSGAPVKALNWFHGYGPDTHGFEVSRYHQRRGDIEAEGHRALQEALAKTEAMRDSYLQSAVNLDRQTVLLKARAGRHLRRAERIGKILEVNRKRNLIRSRHGATPEVLAKPRTRDPIAMLVEKGKLDTGQERAAREIATIYEAVVAALMPRISVRAGQGHHRYAEAARGRSARAHGKSVRAHEDVRRRARPADPGGPGGIEVRGVEEH